jgi:uncharacterized DUF497 family protein
VNSEWDEAKNAANKLRHGLGFEGFTGFDDTPAVRADDRRSYGEARFRAFGRIDGVGHCLVYTLRGSAMRLISFRRAREKEMRRYE